MGAKYGILFFSEYPDPYSSTPPEDCFEKYATHILVHFKEIKDFKDKCLYFRDTIYVSPNGEVYYKNLIFGQIKYELRHIAAPKIIDDVEYNMEICIQLIEDTFLHFMYDEIRKIIDSENFVKKINKIGAEFDAKFALSN